MSGVRVLHTESSAGWGGQENRTLREVRELGARGVHAAIACRPGAKLGARAREAGLEVHEVPMRGAGDLGSILALRSILKRGRFDVVSTHSSGDTLVAGLAARLLWPRPVHVRTRHLILPITHRATYTWLPDHVVAVTHALADYLASAGVPRERISVIGSGIDLDAFDPDRTPPVLRSELGLAKNALVVGTVAILRVKKGHRDLLEAVPAIVAAVPEAVFVLAGDGPQRANLEREIAARGLADRVRMIGLRHDVANVLASLDLFVLPTHEEAGGQSFLEAQAMRVPVVSTRVGGVPEMVREGETALLVPPRDPAALAEAVIALARDPHRRRRMGEAARAWVLAEHGAGRMAERMLALYERLLAERGR
ncbi:MAG: glycosyltransferase [Burkholderiales bacterium]|nr:glycosyltransferase [Burkholderiales bacterium]